MLHGREGQVFAAVVTDADDHGARMQLRDLPVVARLAIKDAEPGDAVTVKLLAVDPERQRISFEPAA
jgi:exoribonuclease R